MTREAARKWSREGKHLFGASRYTDHLQIAQLVPDFPWLCLATRSSAPREAARADGTSTAPGSAGHSIPPAVRTVCDGLQALFNPAPLQKAGSGFIAGLVAFPPQSRVSPAPGVSHFPFPQVPRAPALPPPHTQKIS